MCYCREEDNIISLETRTVSKLRWATAIVGLFVGFLLISIGAGVYSAPALSADTYAVVIDAGSSHTSTYLYLLNWPDGKTTANAEQVNKAEMSQVYNLSNYI